MTLSAASLSGDLHDGATRLLDGLGALDDHTRDFVGTSDALLSVTRRTRAMIESVNIIMQRDDAARTSYVSFCESEARGGGAVGASPVEIGPLMAARLWARRGAVVMTSATLSTAGDFAFMRRRLGAPNDARDLTLPSPFDFASQAGLYVPRGIPEPRAVRFIEVACDEIRRLVALTRGGAFVLCTSVRMMKALRNALRGAWHYPTSMQGEAPKRVLLERFRAAGDAVLFATASFWEGVDVPGRALRLVVIDKLPFDAPNDPVTAARIARLTEPGLDAFDAYQVPTAALALKQGFGRLIRTRHDVGIVAVLDRRLLTRDYGRRLLDALPPASRLSSHDEVRAFWEMVSGTLTPSSVSPWHDAPVGE
jgi:ATP-dependent DNA helicase DinG